jgi:hypothetical protein
VRPERDLADAGNRSIVSATVQTQPWWGTALIAGFFAIFGIVAGQLITGKRENKNRWIVDRRAIYAQYSVAFTSYLDILWYDDDDSRGSKRLEELKGASRELGFRAAEIQMIASDRIRRLAHRLTIDLNVLSNKLIEESRSISTSENEKFLKRLWEFLNEARVELGLGKGK